MKTNNHFSVSVWFERISDNHGGLADNNFKILTANIELEGTRFLVHSVFLICF